MRKSRSLWSALTAVLIVAGLFAELRAQDESVRTIENDYLKGEEAFVADALFLAELHQAYGDTEAARKICRKLMALRPRDRQLAGRVADLYRRAGAHDDLVHLYESLLTVGGENVSMLTDLARAQFEAGLPEAGLATCHRVLQLRGESPAAFLGLVRDLSARQAPELALTLLDQGLEHHPEELSLLLERALLLYHLGRYERAAADARILTRDFAPNRPKGRLASFLLAHSLLLGDGLDAYFDEAERSISFLEGKHAAALLALGHRLREDEEARGAVWRYRQVLELYPNSPQARDAGKAVNELDMAPGDAD